MRKQMSEQISKLMRKQMRKQMAIQTVGYGVLLVLLYEWFGIAERNVWQLLLSVALGAVIVCGAVWLIARALLPPRTGRFLICLAAAVAVVACGVWLGSYRAQVGLSVASHLTLWFRKPIKPQTMGSIYAWLLWAAGIAGVLVLLPLSVLGRPTRRYLTSATFFTMEILLALHFLVFSWVPKAKGFEVETFSMVCRFGFTYLVVLASWQLIADAARGSRYATTR